MSWGTLGLPRSHPLTFTAFCDTPVLGWPSCFFWPHTCCSPVKSALSPVCQARNASKPKSFGSRPVDGCLEWCMHAQLPWPPTGRVLSRMVPSPRGGDWAMKTCSSLALHFISHAPTPTSSTAHTCEGAPCIPGLVSDGLHGTPRAHTALGCALLGPMHSQHEARCS